jgi:4-amino-4-deoxy-L-arabinose transferase-like glycosyltransferase
MSLFNKNNILFIASLFLLFFIYGFDHILWLRPQSMHQWRQADCLQIVHNYLTDSWNFFSPSIHNYFSDGETSGKTMGEFPIIYYFVAILWKAFGEHEFIFRIVNLIIFFTGIFALYKLLKNLLNSVFWSFTLSLFLFTSPILIFYSNNFLTNVPAFSFVLIGWFYFYKFYQTQHRKWLYITILFFTLGGLLKMTAYISFIVIGCFYLIDVYKSLAKKKQKLFPNIKNAFLPFLISALIVFAWYSYAAYFTGVHGGKYTFNGLWPIWEMQEGQFKNIKKFIREILIHQVFNRYSLMVIVLFFILLVLDFKKLNKFILVTLFLLIFGVSAFVLLWFQALEAHDYYVINLIILPFFVLVAFFWHLRAHYPKAYQSTILKTSFLLFLIFNIVYARNNIRMRYWGHFNYNNKLAIYLCDKPEIDFWWWTGSQNYFEALNDIESYNRSIGIEESDLVVFIPDQGFATSLYLMNQKGWTSGFGIENYPDVAPDIKLKNKIEHKNLNYLFVGDSLALEKEYLKPFLSTPIGNYKGINIYKLSN